MDINWIYIYMNRFLTGMLILSSLYLSGCNDQKSNELHFAISAEYPPFEYLEHGELKGFDIDLADIAC